MEVVRTEKTDSEPAAASEPKRDMQPKFNFALDLCQEFLMEGVGEMQIAVPPLPISISGHYPCVAKHSDQSGIFFLLLPADGIVVGIISSKKFALNISRGAFHVCSLSARIASNERKCFPRRSEQSTTVPRCSIYCSTSVSKKSNNISTSVLLQARSM